MEENVNARVGQTVRMECQAEGIPQPTISWKKFGKRGGSVLGEGDQRVVAWKKLQRCSDVTSKEDHNKMPQNGKKD